MTTTVIFQILLSIVGSFQPIKNSIKSSGNNDGIDIMSKVKFCVAWINVFAISNDDIISGEIIIDNCRFNHLHHTDFTSYLQQIGIISQEEHISINKEWLDITNGEPYYTL